jgi:hypothetical protein
MMSSKEQESSESDNGEQEEVSTLKLIKFNLAVAIPIVIGVLVGHLSIPYIMRLNLVEVTAFTIANLIFLILFLYWISNQ